MFQRKYQYEHIFNSNLNAFIRLNNIVVQEKNLSKISAETSIKNVVNRTQYVCISEDQKKFTFDVYFDLANENTIRVIFPNLVKSPKSENQYEKKIIDFLTRKNYNRII
jgi:hypothetical protein